MERWGRMLFYLAGIVVTLIGAVHLIGGVATVPWLEADTAFVDSRERFNSAILVGYGLMWVWVARQPKLNIGMVKFLSAIFLLAGLGRALSWVTMGRPHWFQIVLMAIELVIPIVFLLLAARLERTQAHDT